MTQIKTILKVIYFLSFTLLLFACQDEDELHQHGESIIEKISIEDLPEITGFLNSQKSLMARNSDMSILDSISPADVIVIQEEDGTKSYTFALTIIEPSTRMTNLVIRETIEGFEYFTVTYESENLDTWKQQLANNQEPTVNVEITKNDVSSNYSSREAYCEVAVTSYTCPSGQHSGALQGDCVYSHAYWSYKITFMMRPCSNDGGGNGGGGGSTGTTSPNTGNTPTPNEKEFAKIKNVLNSKNRGDLTKTYKDEIVDLASKVSDTANENGRYLTDTNLVGVSIAGNTITINTNSINYKSISHTHNNDPAGKYSIFSFEDLKAFSELLHKGKINSDFVATLSTSKGTNYALTISDVDKFKAFFYSYNNNGVNNRDQWYNNNLKMDGIEKKYYNKEINPLISQTDTNNDNVLKKFLEMITEADMGVALFEANASFTTFTKVTTGSYGTILRESFNL